jgi:zinc-binding alcohol dehydrogenase family protein
MRVVECRVTGSAEAADCLVDAEAPDPVPEPRDLLVAVQAVSVNPVDTKVRRSTPSGAARILGWDAAGTVVEVGAGVEGFRPGDEVYYAGDLTRPGSNAQLQVVDERIAARKPASLGFAAAAALPLTTITAWELLFDRLLIDASSRVLIIGAAGGVGSIAVQLAKRVAGATVVGTASRPQSRNWVLSLGADSVVDHSAGVAAGLRAAGIDSVTHVASLTHSDQHFADAVAALAPQGAYGLIDDPAGPLDLAAMKRKSLSLHWEFMFTRSMFTTADLARQGELLARAAALVDAGRLRATAASTGTANTGTASDHGPITAANLIRAHEQLETGRTIGKVVLSGWN